MVVIIMNRSTRSSRVANERLCLPPSMKIPSSIMVSSKLGLTEENQEHITLSGIVLNAISDLKNEVSQGIVWELGAMIKICRGCDGFVSLVTTTFE